MYQLYSLVYRLELCKRGVYGVKLANYRRMSNDSRTLAVYAKDAGSELAVSSRATREDGHL